MAVWLEYPERNLSDGGNGTALPQRWEKGLQALGLLALPLGVLGFWQYDLITDLCADGRRVVTVGSAARQDAFLALPRQCIYVPSDLATALPWHTIMT